MCSAGGRWGAGSKVNTRPVKVLKLEDGVLMGRNTEGYRSWGACWAGNSPHGHQEGPGS